MEGGSSLVLRSVTEVGEGLEKAKLALRNG